MIIPIIISVRGLFLVSIIILGLGIYVIILNSKNKTEYEKITGYIEYLDKEFQNLPRRHKGDYRYLKIDSYPYLFEIYKPNGELTKMSIDNLKIGDKIAIYYYETSDTSNIELNRCAQFIDKGEQPYFIRNGFKRQIGFLIIGLSVFLNVLTFIFWKKGKLSW